MDWISIDPSKVNVMVIRAMPTSVIKVRSFLSLAEYYNGMIFKYSSLIDVVDWTKEYNKRFQELKQISVFFW
jgi:hypothetical protein